MRALVLSLLLALAFTPAAAAQPDLVEEVEERADRVGYCLHYRPTVGCVLGVEPDPVACLVNYLRTQTPCR